MRTALITCGALGSEVLDIVGKYGWDVDVIGISARDHLFPERIASDVETRVLRIRDRYDHVIAVIGDCDTYGALDQLLQQYDIERIAGTHCYEWYDGEQFASWAEEEPGTFFLTDFLLRTFDATVIKGMGLDRHPELRHDYLRHYRRVLYLAQQPTPILMEKANTISSYLDLPMQVEHTGYGLLETRLVEKMNERLLLRGA